MDKNNLHNSNRLPIFTEKPVLGQGPGFLELITKFALIIGFSVYGGILIGRQHPTSRAVSVATVQLLPLRVYNDLTAECQKVRSLMSEVKDLARENISTLGQNQSQQQGGGRPRLKSDQFYQQMQEKMYNISPNLSYTVANISASTTLLEQVTNTKDQLANATIALRTEYRQALEKIEKAQEQLGTASEDLVHARIQRNADNALEPAIIELKQSAEAAIQKTKRLKKKYLFLKTKVSRCRDALSHATNCQCRKISRKKIRLKTQRIIPAEILEENL